MYVRHRTLDLSFSFSSLKCLTFPTLSHSRLYTSSPNQIRDGERHLPCPEKNIIIQEEKRICAELSLISLLFLFLSLSLLFMSKHLLLIDICVHTHLNEGCQCSNITVPSSPQQRLLLVCDCQSHAQVHRSLERRWDVFRHLFFLLPVTPPHVISSILSNSWWWSSLLLPPSPPLLSLLLLCLILHSNHFFRGNGLLHYKHNTSPSTFLPFPSLSSFIFIAHPLIFLCSFVPFLHLFLFFILSLHLFFSILDVFLWYSQLAVLFFMCLHSDIWISVFKSIIFKGSHQKAWMTIGRHIILLCTWSTVGVKNICWCQN